MTPILQGVWRALEGVRDPEIPPLSIVEMGMIDSVQIEDRTVRVRFMPTFAGCPALRVIAEEIERAVGGLMQSGELAGVHDVRVDPVFEPPWHSDRITEEGRRKLREFGLTPPGRLEGGFVTLERLQKAACPYCGSRDTSMESMFGPTLCRAIHYCRACRQSFEQFKPVEEPEGPRVGG